METTSIHMTPFFNDFMNSFELDFKSSYSIRELIYKTNRFGVEIMTIKGSEFPKNCDPLIEELSASEFSKKFFSGVFFDDNEAQHEFIHILDSLNEVYLLDELEFETFNTYGDQANYSIIRIKGCLEDKPLERLEIACLKVPY